jgi:hypothetical protein
VLSGVWLNDAGLSTEPAPAGSGAADLSSSPPVLELAWFLLVGFGDTLAAGLTAFIALNPVTAMLTVSPMSELPFTIALLTSILLVEDQEHFTANRAFISGILAAIAFLTRTTGRIAASECSDPPDLAATVFGSRPILRPSVDRGCGVAALGASPPVSRRSNCYWGASADS